MADRLAQKPSRNAGRGRVVPPLAAILIVFGASFAAACSDGQYSQTSGQDGTSRNSGITTLATLATSDTTIFESMPQIEGGLLLA